MSPPAWIAFAGVMMALVVQTVGLAFWLGGMSARLRNVEARPTNDDCATQLAALNATLVAMKESFSSRIGDLEHTMRNLLLGSSQPARARRKQAE